jgi:hypothetical protein
MTYCLFDFMTCRCPKHLQYKCATQGTMIGVPAVDVQKEMPAIAACDVIAIPFVLNSTAVLLAKLQRCLSAHAFEKFDEIRGVVVRKPAGNGSNGQVGFQQHFLAFGIDPFFHNVAGRFTRGKFDGMGKVAGVYKKQRGKIAGMVHFVCTVVQQVVNVLVYKLQKTCSYFLFTAV